MEIGKTGVKLDFLGHSGFLITCKEGKRIVIDPYKISDKVEKVDFVLITHSHPDSCSVKDIGKVVNEKSAVIAPADCQSKILRCEGVHIEIIEVGDKIFLPGSNIKIEAVVAYNKHKDYHPKREGWLGYLIKLGNVVIYHAGDTDFIPEMQKLSGHGKHGNEFIVLLPICGKQVMDLDQAVELASVLNPDLAIPMKYFREEEARNFVELCKERNVKAKILEKI